MIAPLILAALLGQTQTSTPAEVGPKWRLWAEAATDVPLHVGARLEVELPHRIRAWTSVGVVPTGYVEIIDAVSREFGDYNEETSEVIVETLDSSLVWRLQVGWRPFERKGWGFDAGYMLATLGGTTTGSALLSAALGRGVPDQGSNEFDVDSTLHLFGFEASHRWNWKNGLTLRAALGFVSTIAASSTVTPRGDPVSARLSRGFAEDLETYLDETYTSYVHTPYIGVGLGYDVSRFFRRTRSD